MSESARCWTDMEEKEEEEEHSVFADDDFMSPSEAKAEQVLCSKLAMDTADMGTLPGAWTSPGLYRTASFERFETEERRLSSLSLRTPPCSKSQGAESSFLSTSSASVRGSGSRLSNLGTSRLRASPSSDRLEDLSTVTSPREFVRRSSNLSQVLSSMKKSPSLDCVKSLARADTSSPPPPPPHGESLLTMGPRRHSNMAVMRLIAETL